MRQVKFRFWRDGKMQPCHQLNAYKNADNNFSGEGEMLMQFTGCEDAQINGNEVWESDIIENCDTKELQVVYWNEEEAAWYCRYVNDESRIVSLAKSLKNLNKVIGNVYENNIR